MTNTPTKMIKERIAFTKDRTGLIERTTKKQMPSATNGTPVKTLEAGRQQFVAERASLIQVMETIFKENKVKKFTKKQQALIAKWNEAHTAAKDEGLQA